MPSTLMMEVVSSSEMSVNFYHVASGGITENSHLQLRRFADLKSHQHLSSQHVYFNDNNLRNTTVIKFLILYVKETENKQKT
jgi:hypothetical protein